MPRRKKEISIIIPFKVDRGYIKHAIASIQSQTGVDYEIILASKGSTSVNINNGIRKAKGELIRYLSDDDMLTPNSLLDTVNYFKNNQKIDFAHSNAYNFYESGLVEKWVPPVKIPTIKDQLAKYSIHGGSVIYRKKCFKKKLFDETLWTCEEYDLNLWLLKNGYKMGYIDKFTYKYRRHEKQKSQTVQTYNTNHQKRRELEKVRIRNRYVNI